MRTTLHITLEPADGKPVVIARVLDVELLLDAAETALFEAEELAATLTRQDPILGLLQRQEVGRLRNALEIVIPGLRLPVSAQPAIAAGIM